MFTTNRHPDETKKTKADTERIPNRYHIQGDSDPLFVPRDIKYQNEIRYPAAE